MRIWPPFAARHLDWYLNPDDLLPDQKYHIMHASKTSNWGGRKLLRHIQSRSLSSVPLDPESAIPDKEET